MRAVLCLFTITVLIAPTTAAALERSAPGEPDELAELLLREGLDDLATDETDWVLRGLLRDGFVQSETAAQRVRSSLDQPQAMDWRRRLSRTLAAERLDHRAIETPEGVAYDIPVAKHPLVDRYIQHFTGRGRWYFAKWLSRADRYVPMMQPILEKKGMPLDTVYLAMIESGFSSHAYSSAAAGGFWQFIPSTGRMYKLRQDTWVDERRDFVKATHSASNYLTTLYGEFGDWHLAWAAYNAGGGRIRRALARYNVHDFWTLIENRRSLAKETQHYVPKIIAAAIVAKNRERYGFGPADSTDSLTPLAYDEVEINGAVALRRVALHLKVGIEELTTLNPELLYQITPPRRHYRLRVPEGKGPAVTGWLASLPATERTDFRQHVVRRGDTLWQIAERYNSTIRAIKEFNGIRNPRYLKVGQRLIVPSLAKKGRNATLPKKKRRAPKATKASRPVAAKKVTKTDALARRRHTVSRGETLWSISQRYRVTVANLRSWNGRRDNTIGVGEVLRIF